MRHIRWLTLALLVSSATLITHWLVLVATGIALGPAASAGALVLVGGVNLGVVTLLWRRRRGRIGFLITRVWMVGSIAALFAGPIMLAALAVCAAGLGLANLTGFAEQFRWSHAWAVGGALGVSAAFGSMFWGFLVGQRKVHVERVDLPLRSLPPALAGLRIAHITDLHIGPQLRAPLLRELIARVNALEPDLIAITGDIFDFDPSFVEEGCKELAALEARHGCFAVLGNHDVYTGADRVADGLTQLTSIRVLRNTHERIEIEGAQLCLVGVDDIGTGWTERDSEHPALEQLATEVPEHLPRVLLIHRPSYFRQAARLGFPISIAGHTHGGQIAPPIAVHHNVSRLIAHWTRGLFHSEDGESMLYVNRGLGVAGPPVRLNCPREIGLLRLVQRTG